MSRQDADKLEFVRDLLDRGTIQLILDPRREEVRVHPELADRPLLRLNISYRFVDSDLKLDWWGVRQTLTFPSGRFTCRIPWTTVFAAGDPRRPELFSIWSENVPPEFESLLDLLGAQPQPEGRRPSGAAGRPTRLVGDGASPVAAPLARASDQDGSGEAAPERRAGIGSRSLSLQDGPPRTRAFTPRVIEGQGGERGDTESTAQGDDPGPDTPSRGRSRPHLRVVKS